MEDIVRDMVENPGEHQNLHVDIGLLLGEANPGDVDDDDESLAMSYILTPHRIVKFLQRLDARRVNQRNLGVGPITGQRPLGKFI